MNRRWTVLLPVIFVSYSLSYLDRANFSFGAAAGMAKDLGISPAENSLLGSLFFLGYFLFQIPGAIYAQKYSAKRLIFFGLIGWGLLASATGLITNITLLYVDRFLLGIVESAVLPAMLLLQSRWLVAQAGWRWMFIIEGLPPVIWAFVWWKVVADHPREAAWFSKSEQQ